MKYVILSTTSSSSPAFLICLILGLLLGIFWYLSCGSPVDASEEDICQRLREERRATNRVIGTMALVFLLLAALFASR